MTPVDLLLFCPNCGEQHIDAPQPEKSWDNPPHRSHECQFCRHVWRPADVPTNGVASIVTKGRVDGNARPRFYATAKDYADALSTAEREAREAKAEAKSAKDRMWETGHLNEQLTTQLTQATAALEEMTRQRDQAVKGIADKVVETALQAAQQENERLKQTPKCIRTESGYACSHCGTSLRADSPDSKEPQP